MSRTKWYTVRLALEGLSESNVSDAMISLAEEIQRRSYLTNPKISWDGENHRAIIQADEEADNTTQAENLLLDDLYEMVYASLEEIEGLRISVCDAVEKRD